MSGRTADDIDVARIIQTALRAVLKLPENARIAVLIDVPEARDPALKDMPAFFVSEITATRLQTLIDTGLGAHRLADSTAAQAIQNAKGKNRG